MLLYLFVLFTLLPLAEIFLLGWLWAHIGLGWTLLIVLGTGFAGATLARQQGLRALLRIQRRLGRGQVPADELFDGALLLIAGCLLVTPGVLTDCMGMALLLPPIRGVLKLWLRNWAARNVRVHVTNLSSGYGGVGPDPRFDPRVVEGQVVESTVSDRLH